jgi:hypothetical protein
VAQAAATGKPETVICQKWADGLDENADQAGAVIAPASLIPGSIFSRCFQRQDIDLRLFQNDARSWDLTDFITKFDLFRSLDGALASRYTKSVKCFLLSLRLLRLEKRSR